MLHPSLPCRRIDGSTPLEQRESAIQAFNRPHSDVFIFLLSIRAAGRGLNLQVGKHALPCRQGVGEAGLKTGNIYTQKLEKNMGNMQGEYT